MLSATSARNSFPDWLGWSTVLDHPTPRALAKRRKAWCILFLWPEHSFEECRYASVSAAACTQYNCGCFSSTLRCSHRPRGAEPRCESGGSAERSCRRIPDAAAQFRYSATVSFDSHRGKGHEICPGESAASENRRLHTERSGVSTTCGAG